MKAIVHTTYGPPDLLEYQDVPTPTPRAGEVLIEVKAAAVNRGDLLYLRGEPFLARFGTGLLKPGKRIPGADVAGRIAAVGPGVTDFRPGEGVFGDLSAAGHGAFAEYVAAPAAALVHKPENISFAAAAAVPLTAVTALQGLRDRGQIQARQRVLINGASGGVGSFAVQLARAFGAAVTAVAGTQNLDLVRCLGADHVLDYRREDFTQGSARYDLIFDTVANHPAGAVRRVLTGAGRYVSTVVSPGVMILGPWLRLTGRQRMINMLARPKVADLAFLAGLLAAGQIVPLIDRCFPLDGAVEALRFLSEGGARGKVVIQV